MILKAIVNKFGIDLGDHNFKFNKNSRYNLHCIVRRYTCSKCKLDLKLNIDLYHNRIIYINIMSIYNNLIKMWYYTDQMKGFIKVNNILSCNQVMMDRACK